MLLTYVAIVIMSCLECQLFLCHFFIDFEINFKHIVFMTNLGRVFSDLEKEFKITAKELAERLGVDAAVVSRTKNGMRRFYEHATLIKMVSGLSDNDSAKIRIVAAVLKDIKSAIPGVDPKSIDVVLTGTGAKEDAAEYKSNPYKKLLKAAESVMLDEKCTQAICVIIRNIASDSAFKRAILAIADMEPRNDKPE